jgi:hypothetical protein
VIAAAFERRHGKQLITKIIFPQDRHGTPIYNPGGKYLVKLHINGIPRKVLVDDRFPLSTDGRLMTSHTWPIRASTPHRTNARHPPPPPPVAQALLPSPAS